MKGNRITWSEAELLWIEVHADRPRAELHAAFVRMFGRTDVSEANLKALCQRRGWLTGRDGRFEAGNPRGHKFLPGHRHGEQTRFRRGHRGGRAAALHQPIGTERISKDGYRQRKINDDLPLQRRWRAVHLIEWEAIHGPLPAGHALKCLDGDRMNTDPANWVCVPRALLPRLNSRYGRNYDAAPAPLKPLILATARLEQGIADARRGRK